MDAAYLCAGLVNNREITPILVKPDPHKWFCRGPHWVTWGLHLLTLRRADFEHLDYMHARALRRIGNIGAPWVSHVSHRAVFKRFDETPLSTQIKARQFALLGHLLRLPDPRDPRQARRWTNIPPQDSSEHACRGGGSYVSETSLPPGTCPIPGR